jgi:PmbA protein
VSEPAHDLASVARQAVETSVSSGAEQAEAWVEQSLHRQIRVYEGSVESLTDAGARGVGIRAFKNGRCGYSYATDLTDQAVADLVRQAVDSAEVSDPDEFDGLPQECGAASVEGLNSEELARWSTEQKVELALDIERSARAHPAVSNVEEAVYSDAQQWVSLCNSQGFASSFAASSSWAYVSAFAGHGQDLMTGLGFGIGRDPSELESGAIGQEAGERAGALVGAKQPRSMRCPVVFDQFVAARFIAFIGEMLSADAAQRGRSLFAGREGEEIASGVLDLTDDGLDRNGLASAPFDGEGSPHRSTALIDSGRLETLIFDSRTGRRASRQTTGNASRSSYRSPPVVGPTNLVLSPGKHSLDDLISQAGNGMLITDVTGLHSGVNPVSGTFSVGATGRLIENGELTMPAREFTIASDLVSMLRSVRAVGSHTRWVPFSGSVKTSALLLAEMTVSGA